MVKNLIFDFGKVLVDYDFESFFRQLVPDEARLARFTPVLYNVELQQLLDREAKPFDDIMADVIRRNPEFEYEITYFCNHYPELVTGEVPGMRTLLTRLKSEGYRLFGLTNWCSKVYHTMRQYDIFRLLDGSLISSEEHLIKPEPEIYHRLLEKFNIKADECVFTDDRPENIAGAQSVGIRGIVFTDALQYERELLPMLR